MSDIFSLSHRHAHDHLVSLSSAADQPAAPAPGFRVQTPVRHPANAPPSPEMAGYGRPVSGRIRSSRVSLLTGKHQGLPPRVAFETHTTSAIIQ